MVLHELFFYLTIILLPTQLGLHFWPDWALVLGRRIDYLSPTLFLTDITILLTLLLWICSPHKKNPFPIGLFVCIGLFVIGNIIFSPSPYVVLFRWLKVFEFGLFGYYIIQTKPSMKKISFVITIPMMYSSIIALIQFVQQHSIGGILWYLGERTFTLSTAGIARINWCWLTPTRCIELLRPYGTFPHPNVLAGFLVIGICLSFYNKKINLWYITTIVVSSITLMLTFSRGVWLIGIIGVVTTIGIRYKKAMSQTVVCIISACSLCIAIAFPYFYSLFHQSESVIMRNELSIAAITMWKSYPLVGVGFNAFLTQLPIVLPSRYQFFLQPPHNIYLLFLSELGILGVSCLALLVYKVVRMVRMSSNQIPFIILIIYGLLGTIDHYPITLQQGQLLTTIVLTLGFLSK